MTTDSHSAPASTKHSSGFQRRRLGATDIFISPVALGCWPISGMTSVDVNDKDSLATVEVCLEVGVNFLDTAFCYGANGESERLVARALGKRRDEMVIATKGGVHWEANGDRTIDGRPSTLRNECDESLRRLNTDRVELLYLHAPDPHTPLTESAGELRRLQESGKARAIGVSNLSLEQIQAFHAVCPIAAVQPPYSMLQREIESDILPWCREHDVSVIVYWPLMKGLLAGHLSRNHVWAPRDGRAKYPMFQGAEWQMNQDLVDRLRPIAESLGKTLAGVVINWTIRQPGITAALCGAKRPQQIAETADAMVWRLPPEHLAQIDAALIARGQAATRWAV